METAIQLHPHDVRDEGATRTVENILKRAKIHTIIPETATLDERHPYPRGILPHNPLHDVVNTKALLEVPLPKDYFSNLQFSPVQSKKAQSGNDYIGKLITVANKYGISVIPWVKGLNASFEGDISSFAIQTIQGKIVSTWLCPSKSKTVEYVIQLLKGIVGHYSSQAVMLDRMRYPDWSGDKVRPERMLTCFCPKCEKGMEEYGIDLALLKNELNKILSAYHQNPEKLLDLQISTEGKIEIKKWILFRQENITRLTTKVSNSLRRWSEEVGVGKKFWLNLWSPSFAKFLGQNYNSLAEICDGAKHFPYHRLGGGADLAGLVKELAGEDEDLQEKIFNLVIKILGLPYDLSFKKFKDIGLPVEFVARETSIAKEQFKDKPIFSGIQIWDVPENDIIKACKAANEGNTDGYFYYCYGWAPFKALDVVGKIESK